LRMERDIRNSSAGTLSLKQNDRPRPIRLGRGRHHLRRM
jgi:hypothetical protein